MTLEEPLRHDDSVAGLNEIVVFDFDFYFFSVFDAKDFTRFVAPNSDGPPASDRTWRTVVSWPIG